MNNANGSTTPDRPGDDEADFAKIESLLAKSLDKSVDSIDAVTSARLSAARHRALEQTSNTISSRWSPSWKSGFAALSVCVLMLSLWFSDNSTVHESQSVAVNQSGMLVDLDILAAKDDVEFYQSLDFLLWLENAPENSS